MIQQSPYASARLIECSLRIPVGSGKSRLFGPSRARLRDLRHRFLGERVAQSFQRNIITEVGGFGAEFPINWGWRASGGVSLSGLGNGLIAFADAAASRSHTRSKFMSHCLSVLGADGLHEIRPCRVWFDTVLREFVNDSLRTRFVTESVLFNSAAVAHLLDEHYRGVKSHYRTLLAVLDLSLAQQIFAESP
jgi:hypothetical protein